MARERGEQLNPNDPDTLTPERAKEFLENWGINPSYWHDGRAARLIASGTITRSLAETSARIRVAENYLQTRRARKELKRLEALQRVAQDLQDGRLEVFPIDGVLQPVTYIETEQVAEGVECDVYKFNGDDARDLGILHIQDGYETPVQRILHGERTIEGYISGSGTFLQEHDTGFRREYKIDHNDGRPFEVELGTGSIMRWSADGSDLIAYEICYPPYQKGRFEVL